MKSRKVGVIVYIILVSLLLTNFQNCGGSHVGDYRRPSKSKVDYLSEFTKSDPLLSMINSGSDTIIITAGITTNDNLEGMSFTWLTSTYEDGPYTSINYPFPELSLSVLGSNFSGYVKLIVAIQDDELSYSFESAPVRINIEPITNPDPNFELNVGLIEQFEFNEPSGTTINNSISANHGTLENGSTLVSGVVGNAAFFDGIDDRASIGNYNFSGDQITVSSFIYIESHLSGYYARVFSKDVGYFAQDTTISLGVISGSSDELRVNFRVRTNSHTLKVNGGKKTLLPGRWYHIAGVYDGVYMIVYQNGEEVGRVEKTGIIEQNSLANIFIGNSSIGDEGFHGKIDDLRVYNRALSKPEINHLMIFD